MIGESWKKKNSCKVTEWVIHDAFIVLQYCFYLSVRGDIFVRNDDYTTIIQY